MTLIISSPDVAPADPTPTDVMYDDVTRAWRNGDHRLAWHLADALLQYDACGGPDGNGGEPLTGFRGMYYVHAIHDFYAPAAGDSGRPEEPRTP
jgi:hypothetical protein